MSQNCTHDINMRLLDGTGRCGVCYSEGRGVVNIFLDDDRETPPLFARTYTVGQTISMLIMHKGNVGILSLDNDLGIPGIENEGRKVVDFLEEQERGYGRNYWPQKVIVHSGNSVAMNYMNPVIERYYNP
jgi:hypothetical protein